MRGALKGALLASLLATGCDNYTYFTVHLGLDSSVSRDNREAIYSCMLFIVSDGQVLESKGGDKLGDPCNPKTVQPGDWGQFNYSTARQSGTIEFIFNAYGQGKDSNTTDSVPFLQATSGPKKVAPGGEVGNTEDGPERINVYAKSCLPEGCLRPYEALNGSDCVPDCPIKDL
jgi:hypothetical protein